MTRTLSFRLAGAATIVVMVVAGIALLGAGDEQEVRAGGNQAPESALPRYGGPSLSVPGSAAHSVEPEGDLPAPPSEAAEPPAVPVAPPTSASVLQCRNSFDPACGAFYFSPPPPPNQPATVEVSFVPATPVAGEAVVVTIAGTDPDATNGYLGFHSSCRSETSGCAPGSRPTRGARGCSEPHGAWDTPPPPLEPLILTQTFTVFFDQPGEHQYSASIETSGPLPAAWATTDLCRPKNLYGSQSTNKGVITVVPLPTASSTDSVPVKGEVD